MCAARAVPSSRAERARERFRSSSRRRENADDVNMQRHGFPLRRPGALIITVLAATDVAYRLLLRETVRRALGINR